MTIFQKIIISFLLVLAGTIAGCISSDKSNVAPTSYSNMSLPQLIEAGWDKQLTELPSIFPGGKFNHGDSSDRIVANYFCGVDLSDIKIKADVSINTGSESFTNDKLLFPVTKIVTINYASTEERDILYKNIIELLIENYQNILINNKNPRYYPDTLTEIKKSFVTEAAIIDYKPDRNISIELSKKLPYPGDGLQLRISYVKTRALSPEEVKELRNMMKKED